MAMLSRALSTSIGPRELSSFPCSITGVLFFYLLPCKIGESLLRSLARISFQWRKRLPGKYIKRSFIIHTTAIFLKTGKSKYFAYIRIILHILGSLGSF